MSGADASQELMNPQRWRPQMPGPQDYALEADVLLRVIQRLNQNPYNLTKYECIDEIRKMREDALSRC